MRTPSATRRRQDSQAERETGQQDLQRAYGERSASRRKNCGMCTPRATRRCRLSRPSAKKHSRICSARTRTRTRSAGSPACQAEREQTQCSRADRAGAQRAERHHAGTRRAHVRRSNVHSWPPQRIQRGVTRFADAGGTRSESGPQAHEVEARVGGRRARRRTSARPIRCRAILSRTDGSRSRRCERRR